MIRYVPLNSRFYLTWKESLKSSSHLGKRWEPGREGAEMAEFDEDKTDEHIRRAVLTDGANSLVQGSCWFCCL